jgi:hypothetical protein
MSTPLSLGSGLPVVVRFATGLRAVSRHSLALLDGRPWPALPAQGRPENLSVWQRKASRWLESLRLGTVAIGEDDLFTVGREPELALLQADLRATVQEGGACRVFRGPYGVGKSHLLEVLVQQAKASGLAVSRVVLDRQRVSTCRPRGLYREIVSGLSLPGPVAVGGMAALVAVLDGALEAQCPMASEQPWERHPYFTPTLAAWSKLERDSPGRRELLYWISGGERQQNRRLRAQIRQEAGFDPGPLYAMKDYRTVWNQLTSLVTGLACLIRDSGLASGLVLVLDEAEMCAAQTASDQRHGDRTLTGLCAAALGNRKVRRPELLRELGGHSVSKDFPPFHRGRNHLYLALGMASRGFAKEVLERLLPKDAFVELSSLAGSDVTSLLQRILVSYRQAFPHFQIGSGFAVPLSRLLDLRGHGAYSPRQIVQQALAFLDGARLWPGTIEAYIEECLSGP